MFIFVSGILGFIIILIILALVAPELAGVVFFIGVLVLCVVILSKIFRKGKKHNAGDIKTDIPLENKDQKVEDESDINLDKNDQSVNNLRSTIMFGRKDEKLQTLLGNQSLNLTFDVVVADGRFGDKKQKMLEKEFDSAGLDIKDYLEQLELIFHERLKKLKKDQTLFDVFWNAYKYRLLNNIVIHNITELDTDIVVKYSEPFEDLLTAIISDYRILDDEMDVLIKECEKELVPFEEAFLSLKERLMKVKPEEVDTFVQFWEAKKINPKRQRDIMRLAKSIEKNKKNK